MTVTRMTRTVVAPLCVVLLVAGCSKEEIVHGLTEPEANEILVVLETAGLKAAKEKEEGGRVVAYKIIVPGADAFEARKVLVNNKLPRPKDMGLDKVYDPANKGLIPTATEEKAGYQLAMQNEIAAKLKAIPGVVEAHVTIVKPNVDIVHALDQKPPPSTASVVLVYNQVEGKVPVKEPEVQRLVAASVEGLDAANVTVLLTPNRPADKRVMTGREGEVVEVDLTKMPRMFGVAVADQANLKRLNSILIGLGALLLLFLVTFVMALLAAINARNKLTKANAELLALKKRAKDVPPPG